MHFIHLTVITMKYLFFMCGVWLASAHLSYTQTITVIDQQTREPIEGVVLISESPVATVVTDAKGQAEISAFQGATSIQFRSLDYISRSILLSQIAVTGNQVELEPSSLNLDQVVISATRWRQNARDVPAKIATISQREVALQNPQTAADLLGISGKVFIQKSQQGGGSPMIRGFATNRLIYTVDGVRMNTAIFRSGNLQNVINIDPFATESAEVLFGPGSVIYGSDAIGGVMSFQTLTPQLSSTADPQIKGKALARYSSANDEKTVHLDVSTGWKKWALVTSFSSWDFDHLRQGRHGPDDYIKNIYVQRQDSMDVVITQDDPLLQIPSAYSQINLMQKVRFSPNEDWEFQYGYHYSTTSPYGRYDRHNRYRNGTLRYAEWDYGPQQWSMHNLSANHRGNNAAYDAVSLRLAWQSFEESRIDRSLNSNERNTQTENVGAYSANLDFVASAGRGNVLYYGFEYVLNKVVSEGFLSDISTGEDFAGPSRYPQSDWTSIAAYVNDEFSISDKLLLQAGLRYNRFLLEGDFSNNLDFYPFPFSTVSLNKGSLTGSTGAVYKPTDNWMMSAHIGTAFRSPNVDDMGKVFDSEPGTVTVPNPDLQAEYAYNFDLDMAKIFGQRLKIDVSAYYTILQNALVRRNFQLNGQDSILYNGELSQVQAIQNAAVATVYGVQAEIELKLPGGFTFISDLSYQRGMEELDDGSTSPARHAAPLFGVSRLRYQSGDLTLECNAVYQEERRFEALPQEEQAKDEIYAKDENGNNYSPAWYTVNFKAMYRLTNTFSISGGVENLTDRRYRPYSSGISGAGRNVVLSMQANF